MKMSIFIILLILTTISIYIPHNSKKYNFSWYSRLLGTITILYLIGWWGYNIFKLFV
jgi:hypothetical protein